MKFLQIKNTSDGKPKILEMGVDFDFIDNIFLYTGRNYEGNRINYANFEIIDTGHFMQRVCRINDCYQSRPLVEINSWCEFDAYKVLDVQLKRVWYYSYTFPINYNNKKEKDRLKHIELDEYNFYGHVLNLCADKERYVKHGSIFLPENQEKYPEMYQKAMETINDNLTNCL